MREYSLKKSVATCVKLASHIRQSGDFTQRHKVHPIPIYWESNPVSLAHNIHKAVLSHNYYQYKSRYST
jgi:hypothetical protein